MQSLTLQWSTVQAIYKAKNGQVIEGKYARVAGNFVNLQDPSTNNTERVRLSPIFQVVFRNLDDNTLYFISRAMCLDTAQSSYYTPVYHHPFERAENSTEVFFAYPVEQVQNLAGTVYSGSVPD